MPEIKKLSKTASNTKKPADVAGIQPFFEKASPERANSGMKPALGFSGLQLFSMFTADIIASNVQFVR